MRLHVAAGLAAFALGACTTEKITYVTRLFNPPPDQSSGFLGYFTASDKLTTCGNCHRGVQTSWQVTKHARAWQDLQASGQATASCNNCHSVSQLGNFVGKPAGYAVVPDPAYHDVQCENCHGPGFNHVQDPEATQPLASITVDVGVESSCSGCHTGIHTPFVEQWKQSAHGSGPGFAAAAANPSCAPCHEGKTAMAVKFGETATNYVERGGAPVRIVCAVCHDPHGSPYEHQLRAPLSQPTVDQLCVRCHSRKGTPPWGVATQTSPARGAHGAQGLLVIGENIGWIPPGFTYDTNLTASSHGTGANPKLCATCHVARTTITDQATGQFLFQSVGHLFEAIPCTDANGIPVPGPCTLAERDFGYHPTDPSKGTSCATIGCHEPPKVPADALYQNLIGRLNNLLDQLWADANTDGVISATDGGLIPQLVARATAPGATAADTAAIDFSSTSTTVAKGALFNAAIAATDERAYFLSGRVLGKTFSTHMASGNGVHNPFFLEALLCSSIEAVRTTYSLTGPPCT